MTKEHVIDAAAGSIVGPHGTPLRKQNRGYVMVCIGRKWVPAHRMIWEAVHGPIPAGLQINHKNGIKHDNRLANLELATPAENTAHAYRIGLRSAAGECNGRAKLTAEQVREIRESSERASAWARRLGVTPRTVQEIRARKTWRHA